MHEISYISTYLQHRLEGAWAVSIFGCYKYKLDHLVDKSSFTNGVDCSIDFVLCIPIKKQ